MGAFGDRLRREREARGVTLGEISESTKISSGFLRALEQEDFERLPGGIFNRGFVRAYCKFLGIDEDAMVADFDAAYDQYRTEQAPPPVDPVEEQKAPVRDYRFSLAVLIPLILLLTIAFWWRHHSRAAEATQSVAAASSASEDRSPARSSAAVESKAKQSIANSKSAPVEKPIAMKVAAESATANNEKQPALGTALKSPEIAAAPRPKPIRVEIHANEDAWLSVIADGKTMMEGVLPAASTRKFRAKKNIYFTTGNAGGVQVSYNGRPLPSLGTSNEVKSLTFTSEGPRQ